MLAACDVCYMYVAGRVRRWRLPASPRTILDALENAPMMSRRTAPRCTWCVQGEADAPPPGTPAPIGIMDPPVREPASKRCACSTPEPEPRGGRAPAAKRPRPTASSMLPQPRLRGALPRQARCDVRKILS